MGRANIKILALTGIFILPAIPISPVHAAPRPRQAQKYSGPIINEADTPQAKFNRKIIGLSSTAAISLIRNNLPSGGRPKAAARKRSPYRKARQNRVHIAGRHFTPGTGIDKGLADKARGADTDERITVIVQFSREATPDEAVSLLELGLVYWGQAGDSSILASLPLSSVNELAGLNFLKWVGEYKEEYKYSPNFTAAGIRGAGIKIFGPPEPGYAGQLTAMGIPVRGFSRATNSYSVLIRRRDLGSVAALPWVRKIIERTEKKPRTEHYEPGDSRRFISAPAVWDVPYTGQGVTIGVYDSGLSVMNGDDFPPGSYSLDGVLTDGATQYAGHGTHVAGIIASRGGREVTGEHNAKGVAPGSIIYSLFKNDHTYPEALELFENAGAQAANFSVGGVNDAYSDETAGMDDYLNEHDILAVFAAGNEGSSGISDGGTAKNVITVGNLQHTSLGIGALEGDSSVGPVGSGANRLKPEIVAPGTYIVSNATDCTSGNWAENACYSEKTGTSQAAPHVTGALALLREHLGTFTGLTEYVKALLINTAIPMQNYYGDAVNGTDPLQGYANNSAGYGLLNAFSLVREYYGESEKIFTAIDWVYEDGGETDEWEFTVPAGAKKLLVTMAYNDDGSSGDPSLVNDLDLWLQPPGGSYFQSGFPTGAEGQATIEKIVVPNPTAGTWKAKVHLADYPTSPFIWTKEKYAVTAHSIYKTPELEITVPRSTLYLKTGEDFTITPTITNTGGYIMPGVSSELTGDFGGEVYEVRFIGSLMHQLASNTTAFHLRTPSTDGARTLTAYARSTGLGVAEKSASISVVVDGTASTGTISINGGEPRTNSASVALNLSADDGSGSGVQHMQVRNGAGAWDDNAWEAYTSSSSYSWTLPGEDGSHTVWVAYRDKCLNISSYPATITLDRAPPQGTIQINSGADYAASTSVTLTLSASDTGGTGVTHMNLKNGDGAWDATWDAYSGGSKGWTLPSGDGSKKVWVAYRDAAMNISSYSATITLDGSPPTSGSVLINSGDALTNNRYADISLYASGAAQMRLSCDNSSWNDWQDYNTSISTALSPGDGTKYIYAQFRDGVGNTTSSASDSITLDTTRPTGTISIDGGANQTTSRYVDLSLSASDGSGTGLYQMRFKNHGGSWSAWQNYGTSKTSWDTGSATGYKEVWVEYKDYAGNTNSYSDTIFYLGSCDPVEIDNGATYVWHQYITLSVNDCGLGSSQYRMKNNDGAWGGWQSYPGYAVEVDTQVILGDDGSTQTMWVEFNNGGPYSDTIILEYGQPTASVSLNGGVTYTNSRTISAAVSATDAVSGVKDMMFNPWNTGWSDWEPYATSKTFTAPAEDGKHTLVALFRDYAGNQKFETDYIKLDQTPPAGSISINGGAEYSTSTTVSVTLSASDPDLPDGYAGSGIYQMRFSNDAVSWGIWRDYAASFPTYILSGTGERTIWVEYKDVAGNVSRFHDSIYVDVGAPTGSITINGGSSVTNSTSAAVSLTASDSVSDSGELEMSFRYCEGSSWTSWESYANSKACTLSTPDAYRWVQVKYRDGAGNESSVYTDYIYLDQTAPEGSVSLNGGDEYTASTSVNITVSATDNLIGVSAMQAKDATADWGSWYAYSGGTYSWNLPAGEGTKTVQVRYKDGAGNVSFYEDSIKLDTAAPSGMLFINGGAAYTNSADVSLTLSATDSVSGLANMQFQNSVGGGWSDWETYLSTKAWTLYGQDGMNVVYVKFRDASGLWSVALSTITLDTADPSSSNSLSPAAPDGENGWYFSDVQMTLSGSDSGSGIQIGYPRYTLNGGTESSAAAAVTVSSEGSHTVEYWAKDKAGNEELVHNEVTFKIDKSSPSSSVATLPAYSPASIPVSWSGTDATAGISSYTVQYMAEGGSWTDWLTDTALTSGAFGPSSPVTLQDQTTYYFRCIAKDHAGNTEEYPGSADAFTLVDVSSPPAPSVTSSTHAEDVYNLGSNAPSFEWAVPSDVSGIAGYSAVLDHSSDTVPGTAVNLTTNSTSYTDLGDGSWYLHVRAADNAGNWGDTDTYGPVKIDVTSPTFSGIAASPDPAKAGTATISFTASEELSAATVTVTQNGAAPADVTMTSGDNITWTGSHTVTAGHDGTAQIAVEGTDMAGSTNTASGSFTVDATAPSAPSASSSHPEDTAHSNGHATFGWAAASDAGGTGIAGYTYAVNQSSSYTLDVSTDTEGLAASTDTADGTYWFHLAAVDNAGNISAQDSYKFIVDTSSPTFTVTVSSDPAHQQDITVTVEANEALTAAPTVTVQQSGQGAPTSVTVTSGDNITWTGTYSVVAGFDGTADISVTGQDPAGNTRTDSGSFEADTTLPTAAIALSSASPLGTGSYTATVTITDASLIPSTPTLTLMPQSTSAMELTLTGSDKTWQGTFFISAGTPEGTATFLFSATDAADNTGTAITSGATFTVETTVDITSGGTIANEDGTKVTIPASAATEDLNIEIETVAADSPEVTDANNNTFDISVIPVQGASLYREFNATGETSGQPVTSFLADLTVTIPYNDDDQDGIVDGSSVRETELRMFHLNSVTNKWDLIASDTADFTANTISAPTSHFSIFSLMQVRTLSAAMSEVRVYPNPCYIKSQSYARIGGIPLSASDVKIYIYNVAGQLVRTLSEPSEITTGSGSKTGQWDGKNSGGQKAASGVYIYLLKSSAGTKTEKFAIFW